MAILSFKVNSACSKNYKSIVNRKSLSKEYPNGFLQNGT